MHPIHPTVALAMVAIAASKNNTPIPKTIRGIAARMRNERLSFCSHGVRPVWQSSAQRRDARLARILAGEPCPRGAGDLRRAVNKIKRDRDMVDVFGKIMREHGPIPLIKRGAGELTMIVQLVNGLSPYSCTKVSYGERYSTRCTFWVKDHHVIHSIPYGMRMAVISGLVTVFRPSKARAIKCWWAEKCAGYRVKWTAGWLVRGYHSTAKTAALAITAEHKSRRAAHVAAMNARRAEFLKNVPLTERWLTFSDSIRGGNCRAGTQRAAERLSTCLGVTTDDLIGGAAVRASAIIEYLPDLRNFVDRALAVAVH